MAQDTNEILQDSNADVLYAPDGHVYEGVSPINVDNDSDQISLEPIAITKIAPSETVQVDERVNSRGNREYRLNVTSHAGRAYSGELPVQVNNDTNVVSLEKVGLTLEYPLMGTVDDETLTLYAQSDTTNYVWETVQTKTFPSDAPQVTESNAFTLDAGYRINGQLVVQGISFADTSLSQGIVTAEVLYEDPETYAELTIMSVPCIFISAMSRVIIPLIFANNTESNIPLKVRVRSGYNFSAATWTYLFTGYTEKIW